MDTTKAIEIKMHVVFTPLDDVDESDNTVHLSRKDTITELCNQVRKILEEQIPKEHCCTPIIGWKPFTEEDL